MKIGFLAMSGLRVYDPKLLELGLTLPGILERGKVVATLPSLGLLYLAAVTPGGHELHYYEAEGDGKEPQEVYDCDLVAISTFSAQVFEAYAVADRLRRLGVRVAMGGLHVTVRPEEAKQHCDHVIIGEGENIWPHVVAAAERGDNGRVWNAKELAEVDVRHLPVPRYDLLWPEKGDCPFEEAGQSPFSGRPYNRYTVQTTRGCPWRCDFCASNVMLRQSYRKRPVEHVIRDIRDIMRFRKRPFIEFADDNTFVDKAWGKELCRQLTPLHLHWFTETDISVADDEELLSLMRGSGCRQVLIGLESPNQLPLEGVELHANFKAKRASSYLDGLRRIQDHGITANGCFVLGLDRHTPDIFEEVYEFALKVPLYEVQITILTAFPGTPLYDRLLAEGRILQPERWDLCTLFDVNYQPSNMTVEELRNGIYWLAERLYTDECLRERRKPFFEHQWQSIFAQV